MDAEEACVQMELLGHNFFMFLNADTNEVNVVIREKETLTDSLNRSSKES